MLNMPCSDFTFRSVPLLPCPSPAAPQQQHARWHRGRDAHACPAQIPLHSEQYIPSLPADADAAAVHLVRPRFTANLSSSTSSCCRPAEHSAHPMSTPHRTGSHSAPVDPIRRPDPDARSIARPIRSVGAATGRNQRRRRRRLIIQDAPRSPAAHTRTGTLPCP